MIEIESEGVSIKAWVEGVLVEDEAKAQLRNIAKLPIVWPHVAVMPDVHYGIGATVGSVVPTRGAIIPAAVGVDLGCVDADTEYLSPTGWRRIADYDGGPVMQYAPDAEEFSASFVKPQAYIKKASQGFLHFKTKYGVDQMLSPDHKVLCWRITGRDRRREQCVTTAQLLADEHERLVIGAKIEFQTIFKPKLDTKLDVSDAALRVQVAVMADGHIRNRATRNTVVHLKKTRKKDRLRELLGRAEIEYRMRDEADDITDFSFAAPIATKTYGDFWGASLAQLAIIADECLYWDGNLKDQVYFTRDKASADFIQYAFSATGRRGTMRADTASSDGVLDYRVFANTNTMVGIHGSPKSAIARIPSSDGFEYCFTVPSGFWIMRRGGNVVVTGNCGMVAVQLSIDAKDLPDSLSATRSAIEAAIPHGRSNNGGAGDRGAWGSVPADIADQWARMETTYSRLCEKHPKMTAHNTVSHLGTLGTGNHFVELCLDTNDRVWVMLHSGSRGVGNRIGSYFIELAKKDMRAAHGNLPEDEDLAYLTEGTDHFADYVLAVGWAQDFARINRDLMMERALEAIRSILRSDVPPGTYALRSECGPDVTAVNCHHNYVQREQHFGEDLWVTRKGAVSARKGQLGIIPGSMGAKSFIVRGRGNVESLHSCSHGAGRKMSRNAAKKAFTLADHAAATAGIECRKDEGVIDETPMAYKSIDDVMAAQADLVEVVATLRQVVCVKG